MRLSSAIGSFFIVALLAGRTVNASETRGYYPAPSGSAIEVGTEQFSEHFRSLRGIEGVHVNFKTIRAAGKNLGVILPKNLFKEVRERIENSGLLFLNEEEMLVTPGQPILNLWPTYEGKTRTDPPPLPQGKDEQPDRPIFCTASLWVSFEQSATLLRQPNKQYKLTTWSGGEKVNKCENRGDWMANAVLKQVDKFIAAYNEAQEQAPETVEPEPEPPIAAKPTPQPEKLPEQITQSPEPVIAAAEPEPLPENIRPLPATPVSVATHCSESWMTYLNVFTANETNVNPKLQSILDELTRLASQCEDFSYVIETHADRRSDAGYNLGITKARANSILNYLVTKGIATDRIHMRPLGESVPLSTGSTAADHAKNRRVVIIPILNEAIQSVRLDAN